MGIIDDINQMDIECDILDDFEQKHIDLLKQQIKRGALFISRQYTPIAEHFCVQETIPVYAWVEGEDLVKKEIEIPDCEIHYLTEIDTIVMKRKTVTDLCAGLKNNKYGILVEHAPLAHMKIKDLIFLIAASQCYASHLAKERNMAAIAPRDFDSSPISDECGKLVRRTIKEKNIATYAYSPDTRKYIKVAYNLLM
jgi:hypothetical protein